MEKRIINFLLKYNKKTKQKSLYTGSTFPEPLKLSNTTDKNYIIGHQYNSLNVVDGEYINILHTKSFVEIKNDLYSTIPVYIYEDSEVYMFSSSIFEINNYLDFSINIDSTLIYPYFAFGYLPALHQTIYKNISILPPNSKIIINKDVSIKINNTHIFSSLDDRVQNNDVITIFNQSVKNKIQNVKINESIFTLSSGLDSLLGLLGLIQNSTKMDTATWGIENSNDITQSYQRHVSINSEMKHLKYLIDDIKLTFDDFSHFADMTGGLSPSSSIYLQFFTKQLVNKGKLYHYYCDYLEVTRRHYKSWEQIKNKYTTPIQVVKKLFNNQEDYNKGIKFIFDKISSAYESEAIMNFYFYDRCINGAFYKNAVIRQSGGIKITLPLDYNFLKYNYSYIKKFDDYTYDMLISSLMSSTNGTLNNIDQNKAKTSLDFCYSARSIVTEIKTDFLLLLEDTSSQEFSPFFDLTKIKKSIKDDVLVPNEEWFLLRFYNLLIFKHKNKIGIQ